MATRILVADDISSAGSTIEIARRTIRLLISDKTDWEICAEVVDGEEAVEKAKIECPDVAIVDIAIPRMNGIQAAREIVTYCPACIMLTDSLHDVQVLLLQLKELGIRGFVAKERIGAELIQAIEVVLNGGTFFGSEAAQSA